MGVMNWTCIRQMTPARKAKTLANCLANYLPTGIQHTSDDRGVYVRNIPFEHQAPIHHRNSGHAYIVFNHDPLAGELARRSALDRAFPVPRVPRVLFRS